MSKIKVYIQLTEDALRDFKFTQEHPNVLVCEWGLRYLQRLIDLSPDHWIRVHQLWDRGLFKINGLSPFDIRGKVDYRPSGRVIRVHLTHFKWKGETPSLGSDKGRRPEVLKELFGLHDPCVSNG